MRTTIFPMNNMQLRPSFWGIDRDLKSILEDMEGLWDGNQSKLTLSNIHESDHAYMATLDIPGVNKTNLDIQIEENHIRVEGTRYFQHLKEKEKNSEKVSRVLMIPKDVDREKVEAHCEDGVLYLAMPKLEKTKPKKIKVSTGERDKSWNKLLGDK